VAVLMLMLMPVLMVMPVVMIVIVFGGRHRTASY